MEIKPSELVEIINACGKNGVSHFKSGEIDIGFNGFVIQTESDYPKVAEQVDKVVVADPNFELQERIEEESDDTELMMITDPAAYEEQLLKGQLENSETMEDSE